MARREHTLLQQIERDLLDDKPRAGVLPKVVMLGGKADSGELRDWASRELHGYEGTDVVIPDYRRVGALIKLDGTTGGMAIGGW